MIGHEVPRNLAAFSSPTTRSYAIILLCICSVRLGPVLACQPEISEREILQASASRTAKLPLAWKLFFISANALLSLLERPPSSSNTRLFFASQSFLLRSSRSR